MMKMFFVILVFGLFIVGGIYFTQEYNIPQIIPEDYNCEAHPGIISDSNPFLFESSQHYVNRHQRAVQKQIEEVCGV